MVYCSALTTKLSRQLKADHFVSSWGPQFFPAFFFATVKNCRLPVWKETQEKRSETPERCPLPVKLFQIYIRSVFVLKTYFAGHPSQMTEKHEKERDFNSQLLVSIMN